MSIPIFFPIPRTRKGIQILMIILAVIFIGISTLTFINWSAEEKALKENGQPDFNTLDQSELKDDMIVTGAVNLAIDWYAEEYETNMCVRTSDESEVLYYLVPIYDANADGTINIRYFITFKAKPGDFDTMAQACNLMWSDDPISTMLTLENAKVDSLPDEFAQYLNEYVSDKSFYEHGSFIDWCVQYNILGTTERSVIESKISPYMIYRTGGPQSTLTTGIVFAGLAVICLLVYIVLKFRKGPITGVIDPPAKDDFSKVRAMETPTTESEYSDGYYR